MFSQVILTVAGHVLQEYKRAGLVIATAESCTAGLVSASLTELSGASQVFVQGFVTYSNAAKTAMLGVSPAHFLPQGVGAVSEIVAREMARGAAKSAALPVGVAGCVAVSITGIAGPDGGSVEKPVGTVHLAVAASHHAKELHAHCQFQGDRTMIRHAAVQKALELLRDFLLQE